MRGELFIKVISDCIFHSYLRSKDNHKTNRDIDFSHNKLLQIIINNQENANDNYDVINETDLF